jgi:hypothetical protein
MKEDIQKAIETINNANAGYTVIYPDSVVQKSIIKDLSDVLEKAGYRIDEAKIERNEGLKATGRILFTVVALDKMLIQIDTKK